MSREPETDGQEQERSIALGARLLAHHCNRRPEPQCADCKKTLTVTKTVADSPVTVRSGEQTRVVCWHCAVDGGAK